MSLISLGFEFEGVGGYTPAWYLLKVEVRMLPEYWED